jgi:hypothetical protein
LSPKLTSLKRDGQMFLHHGAMATAPWGETFFCERALRRGLIAIAVLGLTTGLAARVAGQRDLANLLWSAATVPVAIGLLVSMVRDLVAGRLGVDAIALLAMAGALALGEPLAGAVVALMYSGGNCSRTSRSRAPNAICAPWSTGRPAWRIAKETRRSSMCLSATL